MPSPVGPSPPTTVDGTLPPGSGSTPPGGGGSPPGTFGEWINVEDIYVEDGDATYTEPLLNKASAFLDIVNFAPAIKTGAVINGIVFEIKKRREYGDIYDLVVSIYDANTGLMLGNNKADLTTNWSTTLGWVTYGGAADTWGWTAANAYAINSQMWGFRIQVVNSPLVATSAGVPFIDAVRATIYTTGGAYEGIVTDFGAGFNSFNTGLN